MSPRTFISIALALSAVVVWRSALASSVMGGVAALLVLIALLLSGLYFVADAMTGNGIDESVLYHLTLGVKGAGYGDFSGLIAFSIVYLAVSLGISIVVFKTAAFQTRPRIVGRNTRIFAGFFAILLSFGVNPAVHDVTQLFQRANAATGARPALYIENERIALSGERKNFVILYLEQLERTYFDEALFPGLMPQLSALEEQALSFVDIQEVPGTDWTIGGMTASLCGVPLVAPHANMMSRIDWFLPGATCVGDLLSREGYDLDYMGGADLDFGGKGIFYRTHSFDRIEGRADLEPMLNDPDYTSWWGLYDDTLFGLAKQRFDDLASGNEPFGLVLLTLDTHQPDGHLAAACEDRVYGDGTNPILNAVHCADRMVADFIQHIRQSQASDRTIVVVASDHLAMPNTASKQLATVQRRNLLLFFGPDIASGKVDRPGSTLDVAPTLLNLLGADIEGLGFGRDLLKPGPTISEMERSATEILWTHWNFFNSLWFFPQLEDGIRIDLLGERLVLGDRYVGLPALFVVDKNFTVNEVRFEDEAPTLQEQAAQLPFDQFFVWVDACEKFAALEITLPRKHDRYCAVFGTLGDAGLTALSLPNGMLIEQVRLRRARDRSAPDPDVRLSRVAAFVRANRFAADDVVLHEPSSTLQGHFGFVSSGFGAEPSIVTNIDLGSTEELARGLTILGLDPDRAPQKLGHIDTCAYDEVLQDTVPLTSDFFGTLIELNSDQFGAFAIVAHGSVVCGEPPELGPLFEGTPLKRWAEISYRQPYIALIDGNGEVAEYLGDAEQSLAVEALSFIRQTRANTHGD